MDKWFPPMRECSAIGYLRFAFTHLLRVALQLPEIAGNGGQEHVYEPRLGTKTLVFAFFVFLFESSFCSKLSGMLLAFPHVQRMRARG